MNTFLYVLVGIIAVLAAVGLIWRRNALPCPAWLSRMVEMDNPFTRYNRAAVIVELLDLSPGMKVLDAGCGPGRLTLPLAKQVGPQGEVMALDLQEAMLARARLKVDASGLENVTYLHASLGTGELPQMYFDRALLVTVLGEIPNQVAALKEIHTALKPGGILSVTEVIFDPHFQRHEAVVRVAEAAGFREKAFVGKKLAYTLHLEK